MLKDFSRVSPVIFQPKKSISGKPPALKSLPSIPPINQTSSMVFKVIRKKGIKSHEILQEFDGENLPQTIVQYCCQRDSSTSSKIIQTPSWSQINISEVPSLFIKKCNACCGFCDFSQQDADYSQKITKTHLIEDIIEGFESVKLSKRLSLDCIQAYFNMFGTNIFQRPLVSLPISITKNFNFYQSNDYVIRNMEWPHLELIYKSFESLLNSNTIRSSFIHNYLTTNFIHQLFLIFRYSPDKREQMAICSILISIGSKFQHTHSSIHKECTEILLISHIDSSIQYSLSSFFEFFSVWTTIYKPKMRLPPMTSATVTSLKQGMHHSHSISISNSQQSLLQIAGMNTVFSPNIQGHNTPNAHKMTPPPSQITNSTSNPKLSAAQTQKKKRTYLRMNILPLVMLDAFVTFEETFTETIGAFISSDKSATNVYFEYMISHYPVRNTKKQKIFLQSINKILNSYWKHVDEQNIVKIVDLISSLFVDSCWQISDMSLRIGFSDGFLSVIKQNAICYGKKTYYFALKCSNEHWNDDNKDLAKKLIQKLEDINPEMKTDSEKDLSISKKKLTDIERKNQWMKLKQYTEEA